MTATATVKRSQIVPLANGQCGVQVKPGVWLSIQADGTLQMRPSPTAWETGWDRGDTWVVIDGGYPTGAYALRIDDKA